MTTNKMWGGRFESGPASIMEDINTSIDFDKRLAAQDLAGSDAHAAMLAATGIIEKNDADSIRKGLAAIREEIAEGSFPFRREFEDIHMNVEARLAELIGAAAGRGYLGAGQEVSQGSKGERLPAGPKAQRPVI